MTLIGIIGIIAVGQGLHEVYYLIIQTKKRKVNNLFLSVLLLSLSISVLEYSLVWIGKIHVMPHMIGFSTIAQFLFLPLIYLYLINDEDISKSSFWHIFPIPVILILMSNHIFQSGTKKLENLVHFYQPIIEAGDIRSPLFLFFGLQFLLYYFPLRKKLSVGSNKVKLNIFRIFVGFAAVHFIHTFIMFMYVEVFIWLGIPILLFSILSILYLSHVARNKVESLSLSILPKYSYSKLSDKELLDIKDSVSIYLLDENRFTSSDVSLKQVSKNLKMPAQHISQAINQITTLSFRNFINGIRIDYAEQLIHERINDLSLKEIAFQCGFNNKTSFANAFKKKHGMTPSMFVTSIRQEVQIAK